MPKLEWVDAVLEKQQFCGKLPRYGHHYGVSSILARLIICTACALESHALAMPRAVPWTFELKIKSFDATHYSKRTLLTIVLLYRCVARPCNFVCLIRPALKIFFSVLLDRRELQNKRSKSPKLVYGASGLSIYRPSVTGHFSGQIIDSL